MANNIGAFKVSTTLPLPGSKDVSTSSLIQVSFNTDVDTKTISGGIVVMCQGEDANIKGALSYDQNMTIAFKPAVPLTPGREYTVIVKPTIKNILGVNCQGYNFSFATKQAVDLAVPVLVSPADTVMVGANPTFSWNSVKGADGYKIELSLYDTFSVIAWDTTLNCEREANSSRLVSVTPDTMLREDTLYYWRVQPFQIDKDKFAWGPLTEIQRFSVSRDQSSVIAPEDEPYIDPAFEDDLTPPIPELLEVFPEMEFSNVGTNLRTMYARVKGILDPLKFDPRLWFFAGEHITQDPNMTTYDPADKTTITSKSHHGEMKGSWSVVVDNDRQETVIIFQPVAL